MSCSSALHMQIHDFSVIFKYALVGARKGLTTLTSCFSVNVAVNAVVYFSLTENNYGAASHNHHSVMLWPLLQFSPSLTAVCFLM
jgi:hypothetical protein